MHKRLENAPLDSYVQTCILEYHWSLEEIVERILREFSPKDKDITDTPEHYIQWKDHKLNLRSRK